MAGIISMNTHLKGVLVFSGVFDLEFLLIVDKWHDVQKGSGSTLRTAYCQTSTVSPFSTYLVNMFPNIWCNISIESFFLRICFCDFEFYLKKNQKCMFSLHAIRQ